MTEEEKKAAAAAEQRKAQLLALIDESVQTAVSKGTLDITNAFAAHKEMTEKALKTMEETTEAMRVHNLPGSTEETHEGETYNFGKVFRGLLLGNFEKECPMEFAMSKQLWDMGTVPDSAGGFLVPTQVFEDQIIPLLRPQVIALELGITQLPVTGAGTIEIPREVTGPTVDTVAENFANTSSDLEFGNHRMEPHTAQSYIKASRRFLSLGAGADQFIRRRMAQELALKWNSWTLKGTGANGEPIGVYNTAGVNSVSFTGAVSGANVTEIMFTKLLEMEDALADADALTGAQSLGWAIANKFLRACRQIKSENEAAGTQNLEMNRKVFSAAAEEFILGYKYMRTTQLVGGTATEGIFGDWSKAVLATWGNLSIEASNTASDALAKRQTHIVAHIDVDVAVTQPTAFAITADLNTSGL